MKIDNDWVLAMLPSGRNLDKKSLLKMVKKNSEKTVKKFDFADEKWLKKNMKLGKLGAIPPFGNLLKKELYLDKLMAKEKRVYVSSGEYDASLKLLMSQLVKIERPIVGNFSVKKPKK